MTFSELGKFFNFVAEKIDPLTKELLTSYVDEKNKKLVYYQVATGGKRLRPGLAIASCKMLGGELEDVLYSAANLEILHNYSLIIDDIIDRSKLRRREPTYWFKYGRSIAQCISVSYSAALLQGANRSKYPQEISELLARTTKSIVDGEILDLLFEQTSRENEPYIRKNRYREITLKDYFKMVDKKTAVLIEASCQAGGIAAGANDKELGYLKKYGSNLGRAFQIKDDILDIVGKEKTFGKKPGKDIIEGKLGNLVILFALKELSPSDKGKFLEIIRKRDGRHVSEAVRLIKKTKSISKATDLGESLVSKAKNNLALLPQNKYNEILDLIADFVMAREK